MEYGCDRIIMAVNRLLRTPSPLTPKIFFDTDIATEDELYGNDGFNGVTIGICSMNCKVVVY